MAHPTVKSCLRVVVAGSLLAGCAQYEAQQQAQANAQAQAQAAGDDAQCQSYGVMPGSPGYVQCRMNLDNQRAAAFQQRQAILGAYILNRH
jgi:primosomal replication protein N